MHEWTSQRTRNAESMFRPSGCLHTLTLTEAIQQTECGPTLWLTAAPALSRYFTVSRWLFSQATISGVLCSSSNVSRLAPAYVCKHTQTDTHILHPNTTNEDTGISNRISCIDTILVSGDDSYQPTCGTCSFETCRSFIHCSRLKKMVYCYYYYYYYYYSYLQICQFLMMEYMRL